MEVRARRAKPTERANPPGPPHLHVSYHVSHVSHVTRVTLTYPSQAPLRVMYKVEQGYKVQGTRYIIHLQLAL